MYVVDCAGSLRSNVLFASNKVKKKIIQKVQYDHFFHKSTGDSTEFEEFFPFNGRLHNFNGIEWASHKVFLSFFGVWEQGCHFYFKIQKSFKPCKQLLNSVNSH